MRRLTFLATLAIGCALVAAIAAQGNMKVIHPGKGGSPHVRATWVIDDAAITMEYGRPSLKGRPEAELMPPGKPWRTGADEATIFQIAKAIRFGTITLQPDTYTINTQPEPGTEWELIFGKFSKPGQWGIPYQAQLEIGRVPMKVTKLAKPVETLTIHIDDTPAGGTLRIEWGTVSATAPFTVVG